MLDGLPVK